MSDDSEPLKKFTIPNTGFWRWTSSIRYRDGDCIETHGWTEGPSPFLANTPTAPDRHDKPQPRHPRAAAENGGKTR